MSGRPEATAEPGQIGQLWVGSTSLRMRPQPPISAALRAFSLTFASLSATPDAPGGHALPHTGELNRSRPSCHDVLRDPDRLTGSGPADDLGPASPPIRELAPGSGS